MGRTRTDRALEALAAALILGGLHAAVAVALAARALDRLRRSWRRA